MPSSTNEYIPACFASFRSAAAKLEPVAPPAERGPPPPLPPPPPLAPLAPPAEAMLELGETALRGVTVAVVRFRDVTTVRGGGLAAAGRPATERGGDVTRDGGGTVRQGRLGTASIIALR